MVRELSSTPADDKFSDRGYRTEIPGGNRFHQFVLQGIQFLYLLGRYECGAYLYNETRATKVEGADPKKNADKRVFSSRWKIREICFYKDIADSEGWGYKPENIQTVSWKKKMYSRWER